MEKSKILTAFASRFVRGEFRERFLHEAAKKPVNLHRRICHDIGKVFDGKYEGHPAHFQAADKCLFLGWSSPFILVSWAEAREKMKAGGGGYLVIKSDGAAFYAETESYPPVAYAGTL
jgi:hypothetical protein